MKGSLIPVLFAAAAIFYAMPSHAADESRIARACAVDMGLNPSEVPYAACVDSLRQEVAAQTSTPDFASGRRACAAEGLQPGTSDFSLCVVRGGAAAPR